MRRTVIWIERFHASTSLTDSKASSISSDGCIYSYAWEISQWMQMRSEMQLPEAAINSRRSLDCIKLCVYCSPARETNSSDN
jgi:hypothetical protein